ncbi:MAG TPA: Rieske (2Fe-2S) protein [Edaphocola sp.]|nr:Rieske (2Fe-2S) protein [Edaphocola sp.]
MDRRSFLKGSCKACLLMSAGMMLGASFLEGCAGLGGSVLKASAVGGKIRLPVSDFAMQKTRLVRVSDYEYDIAVREISEGNFLALLMKCTHAGQPLTKTGSGFYCTLHGSRFSPTGIVENGPASQPLAHLPVVMESGQLVLTLIDPSKV